jgi:leader peptidase (prepilin peptidase)/N-methyltransferase
VPLLNLLQSSPVFFYTVLGILGLLVGSFLNVVIQRLPKMMENEWREECSRLLEIPHTDGGRTGKFNLVVPRSRCPYCSHKITALENIPVLSYFLLRGKCSECRKPISIRYPLIETTSAVIAVFLGIRFGFGAQVFAAILLSWALLALSVIDFDRQLLPDDITIPFLWIGVFINMFGIFTDVYSSLIGAMAGYGILWVVYILFKIVTGKEGMGYGDFKLLAMLGAWLGWQQLPVIIILSSLCGALVGTGLMIFRNYDRSRPLPFGPYLAVAGWISMSWGSEISGAYSQWALHP